MKSKLFSGKEIYEISKKFRVYAKNKPSIYEYKLIKTYPHDIEAYTQGLEFINDTLYESTGQYGTSSLRKVDYKTGKVLKKLPINKSYFTEGITHYKDKIIQLTWKENIGFVYNRKTFELLDTFLNTTKVQKDGDYAVTIFCIRPMVVTNSGKLIHRHLKNLKVRIL